MIDQVSEIQPIPKPPSLKEVLEKKVAFPFDATNIWGEAFNHLKVERGDPNQEPMVKKNEDGDSFTLTLPENPTLGQVLRVTDEFISQAGIEIKNPRFFIFTRDLRNMARLLAQLVKQSLPESEQKPAKQLITSLYYLGEGLEEVGKGKDYQTLTEGLTLEALADDQSFEFPQGTNLSSYKDQLFLRMLGKDQAFFDEKSLKDKKLSQIPEHSAYYYLFQRFLERKPQIKTLTFEEQIAEFDQWLVKRKHLLVSILGPSFIIHYSLFDKILHLFQHGKWLKTTYSPLQKSGRTHNALWQSIFSSFFFHLDQAIEEEGWKKAKEKLLPPSLFEDLDPDLKDELSDQLNVNNFIKGGKFNFEENANLFKETKQQLEQNGKTLTLFELAQKMLEKKEETSVYDKIALLLDLVQAYDYKETYNKLTLAVEDRAFECHLRSYILGRLYQEFLGKNVEVYTVSPSGHTKLLVVDKETKKAYWVEPTPYIFENRNVVKSPQYFLDFYLKEIPQEQWNKIFSQIKAHPDNFSLFGQFDGQFATILPFQQGIEAGFWSSIGALYWDLSKKEKNPQKKHTLLKKVYSCSNNALKLNPNDPSHHIGLAALHTESEFAKALGISYPESLRQAFFHNQKAIEINPNNPDYHNNLAALHTESEFAKALGISYPESLRQAFFHNQKAIEINPNDPYYHFNLAILYKKREFAEALGISYPESLRQAFFHYQKAIEINPNDPYYHINLAILYSEREFASSDKEYYENFNLAFAKMKNAFDLNPTPDGYDVFFWVITQIPNDQAQKVFNHLSDKTKKIIAEMYENELMRNTYRENFSHGFKKTKFWQIFLGNYLNSPQNKN